MQKKVTIYGAGYVGLVTGACLAELGHFILLIDTQAEKIKALSQGICPIYEPGLQVLIERHLKTGRLSFSTDLQLGVAHGFYQFITVGTPSANDGTADLQYVFEVVENIAKNLHEYRLIVVKSTVPMGTTHRIQQYMRGILSQHKPNSAIDFDVVSNPEFLKQGAAIIDFMKPDRIIIGVENNAALKHLKALYSDVDKNDVNFIVMDPVSAEMSKYAANAYLATRISFMNELSQLADYFGADINQVRLGIGSDSRIGPHFLMAGCGFGGSCFPKDVRALLKMAEAVPCQLELLQATETVNHFQKQVLFKKISRYFADNLMNKTIALWGLAFKPNTDDMREAPSCVLIDALMSQGATIQAYDAAAIKQAMRIYSTYPQISFYQTAMAALENADVLAIVTDWDEFKQPDFALIRQKLHYPVIFDGRNLYDPAILLANQIHYYGIGHGNKFSSE